MCRSTWKGRERVEDFSQDARTSAGHSPFVVPAVPAWKAASQQCDVLANASDAVSAPPAQPPTPPGWTGSSASASAAVAAAKRAVITPPHLSLGSAVQVGSLLGVAREVRFRGEGVEVRVTFDGGVEAWKRAVEVERC